MIYFYTSSMTWVCCEAHAIFKALTAGIISGRSKIYKPFGYGTPFLIIGTLFVTSADDLGTDPRCFISWDDMPKQIYLWYMDGLGLIAIIFGIIICFNIARPQTKRKNVVADLVSQARGSALACFAFPFFWFFAALTYLRNPESDTPDMYCYFLIVIGFFGVIIFIVYGLLSKRFRQGMRGPKSRYAIQEDAPSTVSRPSTATSMTSAKTISEKPPSPTPEDETPENQEPVEEPNENQEQENEVQETNDEIVQDEVENDTPEAADDNDVAEPEAEQEPPADENDPESNE